MPPRPKNYRGPYPWGVTVSPDLALATRDLRKSYGSRVALAGLDLSVPTGVVYGFLGPNGAGKTTTMRLLTGLLHPDSGSIQLLGSPFARGDRRRLFRVGALVESPSFYPYLNGRQNLHALAATGAPVPKNRVEELLELVGLRDRATDKVSGYSLGMKQRLGLAAALLVPRRLVVLDEPTNGLDPAGTRDVRRIIAELHDAGSTVLLSSHLLAEVEAVCTHVAVLQRGSLLVSGELSALLDAGTGELVVTTGDPDAALAALRTSGAGAYLRDGGLVVPAGPLEPPEVVAALVGAGVGVWEVHRRRPHLEEFFARLTEEDA
jgi:ABC-2 type transport system ATP-binding protein